MAHTTVSDVYASSRISSASGAGLSLHDGQVLLSHTSFDGMHVASNDERGGGGGDGDGRGEHGTSGARRGSSRASAATRGVVAVRLLLTPAPPQRVLLFDRAESDVEREKLAAACNAAAEMVKKALQSNTTLEHIGLFGNHENIDDDLPSIYEKLADRRAKRQSAGKGK